MTAKKETTELAKKETEELVAVPDYSEWEGLGLENVNKADLILPRLSLAQNTSPQVVKTDPLFIYDLDQGEIFNTLTSQIYGLEVEIIPIKLVYTAIKWERDDKGRSTKNIICRSNDGMICTLTGKECECRVWGKKGEKPTCTLFYNFLCILPRNNNELVSLSMKETSAGPAKRLISLSSLPHPTTGKRLPMFAKRYLISSVPEKNDIGNYFNFAVNNNGWNTDLAQFCATVYESMKTKTIIVDTSGSENEETINDDGIM